MIYFEVVVILFLIYYLVTIGIYCCVQVHQEQFRWQRIRHDEITSDEIALVRPLQIKCDKFFFFFLKRLLLQTKIIRRKKSVVTWFFINTLKKKSCTSTGQLNNRDTIDLPQTTSLSIEKKWQLNVMQIK